MDDFNKDTHGEENQNTDLGESFNGSNQDRNTDNFFGEQYSYGYQAPYSGGPLPKNRFVLKLVASILEILSVCLCNVISMILGIVGCVFACGANSCYKQGRYEEFKSKAKVSAIVLWIGLAVDVLVIALWAVLFIGVFNGLQDSGAWDKAMQMYSALEDGDLEKALETYSEEELQEILKSYINGDYDDVLSEYYGDSEYDIGDVLEDFYFGDDYTYDDYDTEYTYDDDYYYYDTEYTYDDSDYNYKEFGSLGDYWKISIEGNAYELPLILQEFIDDGFVTDVENPESEMVDPGDMYVLALSNADGYEYIYVEAYNAGDDTLPLTDCLIIAVEVSNPAMYYEDVFDCGFSMEVGITLDSTYDDLVAAFGEPSYTEESDGEYYYEWDYEEEYYDFILVTISDGVIADISVSYVGDYVVE